MEKQLKALVASSHKLSSSARTALNYGCCGKHAGTSTAESITWPRVFRKCRIRVLMLAVWFGSLFFQSQASVHGKKREDSEPQVDSWRRVPDRYRPPSDGAGFSRIPTSPLVDLKPRSTGPSILSATHNVDNASSWRWLCCPIDCVGLLQTPLLGYYERFCDDISRHLELDQPSPWV